MSFGTSGFFAEISRESCSHGRMESEFRVAFYVLVYICTSTIFTLYLYQCKYFLEKASN